MDGASVDGATVQLLEDAVSQLQSVLERVRNEPHAAFEEELARLERLQDAGDLLVQALRRQAVDLRPRT